MACDFSMRRAKTDSAHGFNQKEIRVDGSVFEGQITRKILNLNYCSLVFGIIVYYTLIYTFLYILYNVSCLMTIKIRL